jgi:hypothetical protein
MSTEGQQGFRWGVAGVSVYLLAVSAAYILGLCALVLQQTVEFSSIRIGLTCASIGGLGGCVYCLRGVYLNAAVRNQWGREWYVWYFLRPIVSAGCGAVSYLFLRAGLLVLESGTEPGASELGFYALAFIAGLNVDKFISKLEDVAQSVWGIEKSRVAKGNETKD